MHICDVTDHMVLLFYRNGEPVATLTESCHTHVQELCHTYE